MPIGYDLIVDLLLFLDSGLLAGGKKRAIYARGQIDVRNGSRR